jgi:hypothetical protein
MKTSIQLYRPPDLDAVCRLALLTTSHSLGLKLEDP